MKHYEMLDTCFSIPKEVETDDYVSINDSFYVRRESGEWLIMILGADAETMVTSDEVISNGAAEVLEGIYEAAKLADSLYEQSLFDEAGADVPEDIQ